MAPKNRSQGWQYAKLSGHKNEDRIKELLETDRQYTADFLKRIGCDNKKLINVSIGGLHETNVESVIQGRRKTKSKTDLRLLYDVGSKTSISIKKSLGGQVYLVKAPHFIECFECQFAELIPKNVKKAINLFWAADEEAVDIIEHYGDRTVDKEFEMQMHHKSLNAHTLKAYNKSLYEELLQWFIDNADKITRLAFSAGAVRCKAEWAEYVWYKNMFNEHMKDNIFLIEDICKGAAKVSENETYYGTKNGGTTIQLPFGFVQWHQAQLQFHHSFDKVAELVVKAKEKIN